MLRHIVILLSILLVSEALKNAIQGKKCNQNQVVNKLTVYEDGAIEAECGPITCGETGIHCLEDQTSCKAESDVFSGMKWARNGQSLTLRCCSLSVANKIYVGTDLVTLGSYYTGGLVPKKDMYGNGGLEYDYIANARTEQGGVRIWVYRIICGMPNAEVNEASQPQPQHKESINNSKVLNFEGANNQNILKQLSENRDAPIETVQSQSELTTLDTAEPSTAEPSTQNPLRYRPQRRSDVPEKRLL